MHVMAAINFHRSFKHWRILSRIFVSSWSDRWAAAVLDAHTAWFALKSSKELYKWFIFDVNFTGRLTFLRTCFMKDSKTFVREKENNLVYVLASKAQCWLCPQKQKWLLYMNACHSIVLLLSVCDLEVSGCSLKLALTTQRLNTDSRT